VFGVYFKLNSFIFMPLFGLNNGSVAILAYNFGAQKRRRMLDTIKLVTLYALTIMVTGTLIFQIFPKTLLLMFNATETMIAVGIPALRRISISFPCAAVCIAMGGAFQATGKSIYSMIVSIIRQLIFLIPFAFVLALIGRNTGNSNLVWWCYPIAESLAVGITLSFFFRLKHRILDKFPADIEK
jgi:Na+-driven multidrug efflux pump